MTRISAENELARALRRILFVVTTVANEQKPIEDLGVSRPPANCLPGFGNLSFADQARVTKIAGHLNDEGFMDLDTIMGAGQLHREIPGFKEGTTTTMLDALDDVNDADTSPSKPALHYIASSLADFAVGNPVESPGAHVVD